MRRNIIWSVIIGVLVTIIVWIFSKSPLAIFAGVLAYGFLYLYLHWLSKKDIPNVVDLSNTPEALRKKLWEHIQNLKDILDAVQEKRVREQLENVHKTLSNIYDFLQREPKKTRHFSMMINHYVPTLLMSTTYFIQKFQYGLSDNETKDVDQFVAFIENLNQGFRRIFQQLFEKDKSVVDIDMSVTIELLKRSGFYQDENGKNLMV